MTTEPLYHDGYAEALQWAKAASLPALLSLLDDFFGRANIDDETDLNEVRGEAIRQIRRDFRNPAAPGWICIDAFTAAQKTGFLAEAHPFRGRGMSRDG